MSKFGQYQLFDRIAVGGMAEVFRGRAAGEEGFEKAVAIKRILPAFARDGRFVSMLVTEARIHSSLTHRNIVQIHDLGVSQDGEYFIVLEYVDGHDLSSLLARLNERRARGTTPGQLSDAVALHIAIELGEGIHFAHELRGPDGQPLGMVHRDISPSNVLLSYAGEVKLSDFGLAKRRTDHSVVGSLKGKLTYMSPEQARRAPIDRRSDLFSLGAVLYEMLAGQALRSMGDNVASWQQVASGLIPPMRRARPDLPASLERLLTRTLAPDPRDRFSDARAFIDDARAVLDELPRPRVGETTDLQNLLRSVLPPGTLRPPRPASRVIRLQSEIFGAETAASLGADLTVPGTDLQSLGLVDRSAVTSIASLESLRISQAESDATPPAVEPGQPVAAAETGNPGETGQQPGDEPGDDVTFTPPPSLTPPLPVPGTAALEWPRLALAATGPAANVAAASIIGPSLGKLGGPGRARGEPRRSAAGEIDVEDDGGDNAPSPNASEDGNRIIAAWPSLLDRAEAGNAVAEEPVGLTPPLGSLGASPPLLPYTPAAAGGRGTPPGGVQAPAPTNPPFPPAPSAPLSASALPPIAAIAESPPPLPSPVVGALTLPYAAPRERINTPPLSALVGDMKVPSRFPHTLTGGMMAPSAPSDPRLPSSPGGAPIPGSSGGGGSGFFAPPPPMSSISMSSMSMSSLAPRAVEPHAARPTVELPGVVARLFRAVLWFGVIVALLAALVHFTVVPLQVLAVWRSPARLSLKSDPSGATVSIDGQTLAAPTPTYAEITRDRANHDVSVTLPGYAPAHQSLRFDQDVALSASFVLTRKALNVGAVSADAVVGGAVGVDAGTGAGVAAAAGVADAGTTAALPGAPPPGSAPTPGGPGSIPAKAPTTAAASAGGKGVVVRKTGRRSKRGKAKTNRHRRAQRGAAGTGR